MSQWTAHAPPPKSSTMLNDYDECDGLYRQSQVDGDEESGGGPQQQQVMLDEESNEKNEFHLIPRSRPPLDDRIDIVLKRQPLLEKDMKKLCCFVADILMEEANVQTFLGQLLFVVIFMG